MCPCSGQSINSSGSKTKTVIPCLRFGVRILLYYDTKPDNFAALLSIHFIRPAPGSPSRSLAVSAPVVSNLPSVGCEMMTGYIQHLRNPPSSEAVGAYRALVAHWHWQRQTPHVGPTWDGRNKGRVNPVSFMCQLRRIRRKLNE